MVALVSGRAMVALLAHVFSRAVAAYFISAESRRMGFRDFIRWNDPERSGCSRIIIVQCDITVLNITGAPMTTVTAAAATL